MTTSAERKIKRLENRLENRIEELKAECELYQMMAHDLASEGIIAAITRKWPVIAKKWEQAE
ncbi:hypothetical protein ACHMW7_16025 [Aminobacter sp. UC22_36]|uniref:hypothetical protein n=1 Tax=Aminobacter sp. UC22_36 TaxID=3374549 RepID=UPI003756B8A4